MTKLWKVKYRSTVRETEEYQRKQREEDRFYFGGGSYSFLRLLITSGDSHEAVAEKAVAAAQAAEAIAFERQIREGLFSAPQIEIVRVEMFCNPDGLPYDYYP